MPGDFNADRQKSPGVLDAMIAIFPDRGDQICRDRSIKSPGVSPT